MKFRHFLRIVEIRTKIVSLSTFSLFHLWYWGTYGRLDFLIFGLSLLAVLAVDMGTTAFNSFFDFYKSVDSQETNRESDKVLVHEKVAPGYALITAVGLFLIAGVLGIILVFLTSWWILVLGILSFLVGFFYSGGPRPLSFTPFGEIFAGGFLGSILWMILWISQTGGLGGPGTLGAFLSSLPSTLFIASILTVNNTCDQVGDKKAGRLTLSILIGTLWSEALIALLILGAYGTWIFLALSGAVPPLGLWTASFGALASIPLFLGMQRMGFSHETKGPQMGNISRLFLLFTLTIALTWFFRI